MIYFNIEITLSCCDYLLSDLTPAKLFELIIILIMSLSFHFSLLSFQASYTAHRLKCLASCVCSLVGTLHDSSATFPKSSHLIAALRRANKN